MKVMVIVKATKSSETGVLPDTKMFEETHDEAKSQGWTALVLDTNGNGKRDAYVETEQKVVTAPSGRDSSRSLVPQAIVTGTSAWSWPVNWSIPASTTSSAFLAARNAAMSPFAYSGVSLDGWLTTAL